MSILFTQALAEQIAAGKKTQTRRPMKRGEKIIEIDGVKTVLTVSGRVKHADGSVRAIPYGRGYPCRWWEPESKMLMSWEMYTEYVGSWGRKEGERAMTDHGWQKFKIEILDIRHEKDVRDICHADAIAEGFEYQPKYSFLETWMRLYDSTFAYRMFESGINPNLPDHCPEWLWNRPDNKYQGMGGIVVYEFKVHGG